MEKQQGQPFDPADCLMRAVADVICGITFGEGYDTSNPDLNKLLKLNVESVANAADSQLATILDFFPLAQYLPIRVYERYLSPFFEMFDIIRKFLGRSACSSSCHAHRHNPLWIQSTQRYHRLC